MAATASHLEATLRYSNCLRRRAIATLTTRHHHVSRGFTTSTNRQKQNTLPTFPPTSSPELDAILSDFRNKIFIPAHLPERQRQLIYKSRHKSMLENEPFYVEIGSEKVQLFHINRTKDEPRTLHGINQITKLMKTSADWENLPRFLAELKNARRNIGKPAKIMRRANKAGMQHVVMECVKQAADTGFVLRDLHLVREVMWGAHLRGQQGGWELGAARKALTQAEYVALLLENPLHSGGGEVKSLEDPRIQPDVIGVLLETAAIKALREKEQDQDQDQDGKDDGKVAQYAERLMRSHWEKVNLDDDTYVDDPADPTIKGEEKTPPARADYEVQRWAPVWKGMEIAGRLLEPETEVGRWLRRMTPRMEEAVRRAADFVERADDGERKKRGLTWYDDLKKI